MQTVRSSGALKPAAATGAWRRSDGSWNVMQVVVDLAIILAIIGGGTPFFIINGSWSVTGLSMFCASLGESGQLAWGVLSAWQVHVIQVRGLPNTQPVLPWLLVIGASACQIATAWMRKSGLPIPQRVAVATIVLSAYDLITTLNGTGSVAWIKQYGWVLQIPASLIVTFAFEVAIGALLAIISNAARRE
jgi:hypothetical protein